MKYPLYEDKVGALPSILDTILSNATNEKIYKSRASDETKNLLVRYGIKQQHNLSFLDGVATMAKQQVKKS